MTIATVTDPEALSRAGALIALSFDHLAVNHYLVADPRRRLPVMTDYFTRHTRNADLVLQTADGAAVAVLFDRTRPAPEAEHVDTSGDRFAELDAVLDAHHPDEPHWHLAFLAVHPDRQRTGLGTALLTHIHQLLDSRGAPVYLEATNADNARLYRRHGYEHMTPPKISLGTNVTFYRLWRSGAAAAEVTSPRRGPGWARANPTRGVVPGSR